MDGNPFQGTEFEQDWADGFNAGLVAPNTSISAPSPLVLEAQDAFNQGVQAGQMINAALDPPVEIEGGIPQVLEYVHGAGDLAAPLYMALRRAVAAAGGIEYLTVAHVRAALTTGAGIEFLFNLLVLVAIWGPRRNGFFGDAVSERLEEIRRKIAESGASDDNLELFMAVCSDSEHAATTSDPVSDLGVWHGPFRLEFGEAQSDAQQHEHSSAVRIHRYQTSQPTLIEVLSP
jgi:hypothetical protein